MDAHRIAHPVGVFVLFSAGRLMRAAAAGLLILPID
jgi:hypothetical protein